MICIFKKFTLILIDEFYEILGGMWHFYVDDSTAYIKCNKP